MEDVYLSFYRGPVINWPILPATPPNFFLLIDLYPRPPANPRPPRPRHRTSPTNLRTSSASRAATGNALVSRASNGGGGLRAKVRAAASLSRRSPPPPPRAAFDPFDVDADPPPRLELTPEQVGHCGDALAHFEEKRKRLSDLSEEFGSLKVWMIICSILVGSTCVIVLKSLQHMGTCGSPIIQRRTSRIDLWYV